MSDNDDRNEDGIYRADTVPPPDGGDDAYNAPTRVGLMAATVVNEMLVAAQAAQSAERVPATKVKARNGEGVDGGELDDRDIEAELDPTAFPPPPRLPTAEPMREGKAQAASDPPSLRTPPAPVFSSPPSNAPPLDSSAPVAPPPPAAAPSTRLPLIVVACAGLAAVLMALAYGVVVTLGGR